MLDSPLVLRAIPALFVFLWSSGWIVAGYSARHADAWTFLTVRFGAAGLLLALVCVAVSAPWPRGRAFWNAAIAGVLLHALYLGPVWWAVRNGLPAGISGLIAGLQPILTALLAPAFLGERITPLRWAGIVLGFVGIGLVLQPQLASMPAGALWLALLPVAVNILGMVSVTLGTFWQKVRFVSGDLRTLTAVQYMAAALVTLVVAVSLEPMRIEWNLTMALVLAWSVLALSLGGVGLLLLMIRRGEVSRIATFLYLVPAVVAVQAWLLFGETLVPLQLAGMALTILGVVLASRR